MKTVSDLHRLQQFEPLLRAAGIKSLFLFGSVARAATDEDSDIDLLFETEPARRFSLLDQARLQVELSDALGRPVDLIERGSLRPVVLRHAERDMVQVF